MNNCFYSNISIYFMYMCIDYAWKRITWARCIMLNIRSKTHQRATRLLLTRCRYTITWCTSCGKDFKDFFLPFYPYQEKYISNGREVKEVFGHPGYYARHMNEPNNSQNSRDSVLYYMRILQRSEYEALVLGLQTGVFIFFFSTLG